MLPSSKGLSWPLHEANRSLQTVEFEVRIAKPWSIDILPFLKEGDSYRRGLRRFLGGFLLLTAYIAIHFTG
jgi:hypothetical protein